ncbi:MAG: replication protein P [Pseudomonadales bacterium]
MEQPTIAQADAISQMFTQFELAYHNQFHKGFGTTEQVIMAQQLWLDALRDIPAERIMAGTRRAIKESKYLPTLYTIRKFCDQPPEELGLPDVYNAYLEACRAASPKAEQQWSHPAVYWAGKVSDWFFLAGNSEAKALPVFKRNYDIICERVINGERLDIPVPKAISETINQPLTNAERKERMQTLRQELDI